MKQPLSTIRMKRYFADILHQKMAGNKKIWIITADLGYKMWDDVRRDYPDRFINVGAAEQAMVDMGIGLALEGRVPFVYSITPFLLYRAFESIRNYINREKIPLRLIGSGRNRDYYSDGFSHWAEEDRKIMRIFTNIHAKWPQTNEEIPGLIEEMIQYNNPYYVNLRK